MVAGIEQHSGISYPFDGLESGIFLNRKTFLKKDVSVEGDLEISGAITSPKGEVLFAQDGEVTLNSIQGYEANVIAGNSIAMGNNLTSAIFSSIAVGNGVRSGFFSFGMGHNAQATGFSSFAHGSSVAAVGSNALAFGENVSAAGLSSFAFGSLGTSATGGHSWASGSAAVASGYYSRATGREAYADGKFTSVAGELLYSNAAHATVIGRANIMPTNGSSDSWNWTDEIFTIGNGEFSESAAEPWAVSSGYAPSNALKVLKNGRTQISNKFWLENDTSSPNASKGEALIVEGVTELSGETKIATAMTDMPTVRDALALEKASYYGPIQTGARTHKIDFEFKKLPGEDTESYLKLPIGYLAHCSRAKVIATHFDGSSYESAEWIVVGSRHRGIKCLEHVAYGSAKDFSLEGTMYHSIMWLSLNFSRVPSGQNIPTRSLTISVEAEVEPLWYNEGNLAIYPSRILFSDAYLGRGNTIQPVEILSSTIYPKRQGRYREHGVAVPNGKKRIWNGDVFEVHGEMRLVEPQGDISMGVFGGS